MTIETPGVPKQYWNASYGLNHEIKANTPSILNGRLKIEGYPITDKSRIKAYIWNTGQSDVLLSSLSITLGSDPTTKGDTTLTKQMEGDVLVSEHGFKPYLAKKRLTPIENNPTGNSFAPEENSNNATLHDIIIQTGDTSCKLYQPQNPSEKKIGLPEPRTGKTVPVLLNSRLHLMPQYINGRVINAHLIKNDKAESVRLELPSHDEWIVSQSTTGLEESEFILINSHGTKFYSPNYPNQTGVCRISGGKAFQKVQSLKYLGNKKYLLITEEPDSSCSLFLGEFKSKNINFIPLKYSESWMENFLSFSSHDQFFRIHKDSYLVIGRGWRYAMNKIQFDQNGYIRILESYFPTGRNGERHPFYYEQLEAAYIFKSGELLLSVRQTSAEAIRKHGNKSKVYTYVAK